jgi:hypothetical protein
MRSSVIVGSSWGKVSRCCSSWGQNVIYPYKTGPMYLKALSKILELGLIFFNI